MKIFITNPKCFPFERDGGTCYTTYEVFQFIRKELGIKVEVLHTGKKTKISMYILMSR